MDYNFRLLQRPAPFQSGTISLWSDAYIAGNVLKKHLDIDMDSGSRKIATIDSSVRWIIADSPNCPAVLDIGCGPGLYGARLGRFVEVYDGIDISPYQIAYARAHNIPNGNTHYHVCDFRNWHPDKQYDTVLLMYAIYSFYQHDERIRLLKSIKDALKPGGRIILEVFTANHYAGRFDSTDWEYIEKDGFWSPDPYLELNAFTRYRDDLILIQAGIIEKRVDIWNSWIELFDIGKIEDELISAGFSKFFYYGSCDGQRFTNDSEVLCVTAK